MNHEKKITEIKQALEKATPGPWAMIEPIDEVWQSIVNTKIATVASNRDVDANLHLIANAPEWLRYLLSELERKDEVIEEQKRELFYKSKEITELREKSWQDQQWFKQASENITEMQKELDREREESRKLREERNKLIEGLKFYANEDNWRSSRFVLGRAEADGGERAQDRCEIENLNQRIKEQEDLLKWFCELKWFRERQGWIRVKDRLPDDDTQVLAVDRYGDQEVVLFVDGYFQPDCIGEVTHWMPLPKPPKGEENA